MGIESNITEPRLNIPKERLEQLIGLSQRKANPHRQITDVSIRKPVSSNTAKVATIAPPVKAKEIKLHPETPKPDSYLPFELKGPTLLGVKVLYRKKIDPSQNLEDLLKDFWVKHGNRHLIAAKHTEFVVEPKVLIGDKLNPQILEALVMNYLANTSVQDSGTGNIEVRPDKLIIKSPKGKPLVIVRDKKIIGQYLSQQD